ncbi:MAG: flagellar biosynthesis protein FliC [Ignavibacteriales bacterium]|nr:MAG: flagellar biosynthesis protein FliC [Ignavibacteriales bacterium]
MGFSVNTNLSALNAYNALAKVNAQTERAQLRLATQKRINSVADDTSGFNIGKTLESSNGVMTAQRGNISSAKNYLSTAESALLQVVDKINAIVAKQVDASDPLKDQAAIANDIRTIAGEISSILSNTKIGSTDILSSASATAAFNVGTTVTLDFAGAGYLNAHDPATTLGSGGLTSTTNATVIATSTANLTADVKAALGRIGNLTQTLDSKDDFLAAAISNNTAAISKLFDADMAMEQLNATKGQIGQQIGTSMLAQLNIAPQNILSLFR